MHLFLFCERTKLNPPFPWLFNSIANPMDASHYSRETAGNLLVAESCWQPPQREPFQPKPLPKGSQLLPTMTLGKPNAVLATDRYAAHPSMACLGAPGAHVGVGGQQEREGHIGRHSQEMGNCSFHSLLRSGWQNPPTLSILRRGRSWVKSASFPPRWSWFCSKSGLLPLRAKVGLSPL